VADRQSAPPMLGEASEKEEGAASKEQRPLPPFVPTTIELKLKGANYVITGEVAEFGRKEVGDVQLFGILGSGKKQVAYSKINLNVVDVVSSEVVYSVQGAGEYALSDREVLGFGGTSSYDSTLNGKVLDLAMREAVNRLVDGVEQGKWTAQKP